MTRLERLLMRVDLIDRVTQPASRITRALNSMVSQVATGYAQIATGVVGIMGVGMALNLVTEDARRMQNALGEVASLGVADSALKQLEKTAIKFSAEYGGVAAEVVASAYDIQSAIAGLSETELANFTEAGAILAKGTKSSAATITGYMGTMYGIFQKNAEAMGKNAWIEQLAGQTALAVQMFKTTGDEMSGAFGALGAGAQSLGVGLNEQLAILGKLQATMSGSEAATKYSAFLGGVGDAQEKLGLSFTDSGGRMLGMTDILTLIKEKFGAIDSLEKKGILKNAFGSDLAVDTITLLIEDTQSLGKAIEDLGNTKGMDLARKMAQDMVDPLDRLSAANVALKISFGNVLLKALKPFYEWVAKNLVILQEWIVKFPHIAKLIGYITLGIFAFTAAISALVIVKGLWLIITQGLSVAMGILRFTLFLTNKMVAILRFSFVALRVAMLIGGLASLLLVGGLIGLGGALVAATSGAWAFAAALLANPLTWIVLGVVAVVAGLVLLVKHWDQVSVAVSGFFDGLVQKWQSFRASVENNAFLQFLFSPLFLSVDAVSFFIAQLGKIPQWFSDFKNYLSGLSLF